MEKKQFKESLNQLFLPVIRCDFGEWLWVDLSRFSYLCYLDT